MVGEYASASVADMRDAVAAARAAFPAWSRSTPQQRVSRGGYAWSISGENLALGRMTAREAVDGWLASPGHCANIMEPRFRETGIALAVGRASDRPTYWVQVFAAPKLR